MDTRGENLKIVRYEVLAEAGHRAPRWGPYPPYRERVFSVPISGGNRLRDPLNRGAMYLLGRQHRADTRL